LKRNTKYLIIGGLLIAVLVLFYSLSGDGAGNSGDADKLDTTQISKPVNPAGTYLLYNLLKQYEKTVSIKTIQTTDTIDLEDVLPTEDYNSSPNLYVSISESFYLTRTDRDYLFDFVHDGNYAIISTQDFSKKMTQEFFNYDDVTAVNYYDTAIHINYLHPQFKNKTDLVILNEDINFHGKSKYKNFLFFNDWRLGENFISIAGSQDYLNCVMIPHGEGFFILHTQPGNFSNVNIARKDGKTNAENIFSHLPKNNIYWHQNFGKYSEYRGVTKPKKNKPPKKHSRSSPLQFIISQPALLAAFILLIIGLVLYMLIFSKRTQKIIPPIESNENSSMEFMDIVSKLYFQQKQHNKLVNHMVQIFISFLRDRYHINLAQKDPNIVTRISEKSGIDETRIKNIITTLKSAKTKRFTEQELIDLHIQLEYFYKHCN
jgi:hypothetical protein